jgi:hypothetical protein
VREGEDARGQHRCHTVGEFAGKSLLVGRFVKKIRKFLIEKMP